jgi:hypothetical protein
MSYAASLVSGWVIYALEVGALAWLLLRRHR